MNWNWIVLFFGGLWEWTFKDQIKQVPTCSGASSLWVSEASVVRTYFTVCVMDRVYLCSETVGWLTSMPTCVSQAHFRMKEEIALRFGLDDQSLHIHILSYRAYVWWGGNCRILGLCWANIQSSYSHQSWIACQTDASGSQSDCWSQVWYVSILNHP